MPLALSRRRLMQLAAGMAILPAVTGAKPMNEIRAIEGSWLDFHHPNPHDGDYWNGQTALFSCEQWQAKVNEMAAVGMRILVVTSVALRGEAFYPSEVMRKRWTPLACADPIEAVLRAADESGAGVFLGVGFFSEHTGDFASQDPREQLGRQHVPLELARRYGHHRGFSGWYLPVEAPIQGHFPEAYVLYARAMAERLPAGGSRQAGPHCPLRHPYGGGRPAFRRTAASARSGLHRLPGRGGSREDTGRRTGCHLGAPAQAA
ncbi:MAG: DUF4434 domain-containing protein [Limnochordaceae bacterium]|nr:DUF4434 domain-containing protein [Limnochordaceae bacterium]